MRLAQGVLLALLLLLPLLHRWWMHRNRPARVAFPLPVPRAAAQSNPLRAMMLMKYLGWALLVFCLARPQTSHTEVERQVSGIDILLVLDVSASMNIEDLAENVSRFDVAKDTLEKFVQGRKNDRIGFVVFSGEPMTLVPLTLDYSLIYKAIREAASGVLKDGTAIGDGLALAVSRLKDSKAKSRVIILMTDGDNNVGQVDPATGGELAAGYGIKTYTVAIGREGRVKLPIRRQGAFGQVVTTYQWFDNALNPQLLQQIAEQTGGKFYRVQDSEALAKVYAEIDRLEKSDMQVKEKVHYQENFQKWLKIALLLILLEKAVTLGLWRAAT